METTRVYSQPATKNEPLPHMPKLKAPGTINSTINIIHEAKVTTDEAMIEESETNFLFLSTTKKTKPNIDRNQLVATTIPARAETALPPRKLAYIGQQCPMAAPSEPR